MSTLEAAATLSEMSAPSASPEAPKARKPRRPKTPDTKQNRVIALLRRKRGATLAELVVATGWQAHSVRGVISGVVRKKLGLAVTTETVIGRGRIYHLAAEA